MVRLLLVVKRSSKEGAVEEREFESASKQSLSIRKTSTARDPLSTKAKSLDASWYLLRITTLVVSVQLSLMKCNQTTNVWSDESTYECLLAYCLCSFASPVGLRPSCHFVT